MSSRSRLLFVDDESQILDGYRRTLRSKKDSWEIDYVNDPVKALDKVKYGCYDVVVSDMKMPIMNGSILMSNIRDYCKNTVRIVLSGQAELEDIIDSIPGTHQYLSKPCSYEHLLDAISNSLWAKDSMENKELFNSLCDLDSLYIRGGNLEKFVRELANSSPSLEKLSLIVANDYGLSIKFLQFVNSAYFGPPTKTIDAKKAVSILGVEVLRNLFIDSNLFSSLESDDDLILQKAYQNELFSIGSFLLFNLYTRGYASLLDSLDDESGLSVVEETVFGVSSVEVSEAAFRVWGIPV